jgi:hypothetical protein
MQKLVTKVALFRRGVRKFTEEVNLLLEDGWRIANISIEKRGLRIICCALLEK